MMANERDLGADVVHGCFSEGGDSILEAPSLVSHRERSCKTTNVFPWLAN